MAHISSLRAILYGALSSGGVQDGGQQLFDELTVNKPQLLKIFDFGAKNSQEQREIESGES